MSARKPDGSVAACAAEALGLLRRHAYYAARVDWTAVGALVDAQVAGGGTLREALRPAFQALGDRHSHLHPAAGAGSVVSLPLPAVTPLGDGLALLQLPGRGSENAAAYVEAAWAAFRGPAPLDLQGCVLDLRGNGGGSVVPMLAAAGPLLGAGPWLRYRGRDGSDVTFRYRAGTIETTRALLTVPHPPADVPDLPVALLVDGRTASAAEGLVVAFRGRPRTRVFGGATAGVPTGNQVHRLGDGSRLVVTSAVSVDRDGTPHATALTPDEPGDEETARAWLHSVAR